MHDEGDIPPSPKGAPVLPLTRPVVAASMAALTVSGVSLFLAGMATGLGMNVPAAAAPGPAPVAQDTEIVPRRLIVGNLAPMETPPLPNNDDVEVASVMVAALAEPTPTLPPPPPVKPAARTEPVQAPLVRVAWTTGEGGTVTGRLADEAPPQHYAIQTGAFGVAANAERQSAELRRLGFEPHTAGHVGSRGVALTVVYAGRYGSRADAESKAKALQKAGIQTYVTALAD